MAKNLSKTGITTGNTVRAWHVTQSIDAFAGTEAYDVTLSGSFTYDDGTAGANKVAVDSDGTGLLTYTSDLNVNSVTGSFSGSFTGNGTGLTTVGNGNTTFSGSFTGTGVNQTLSEVVTNGNTLSDGQSIQSLNGNGYLNLREGSDNIILLDNATGSYGDSGLYISEDYTAWFTDGWTTAWEMGIGGVGFKGTYTSFYGGSSLNSSFFVIVSGPTNKAPMGFLMGVPLLEDGTSHLDMGVGGGGSTYQNIIALSEATIYTGSQQSTIISSGDNTLGNSSLRTINNTGVSRSAIIGGYDIIGRESDAVYMPRLRAGSQANGWDIRFDGDTTITGSTIISGSFTYESGNTGLNKVLVDSDGTGLLTYTSDLNINSVTGSFSGSFTGTGVSQTLSEVVTNGNTLSNGQTIDALNGGGQLDLRYGSTNNQIMLSNDSGGFGEEGFYMEDDYIVMFVQGYNGFIEFDWRSGKSLIITNDGLDSEINIGAGSEDITIIEGTSASINSNVDKNHVFISNKGGQLGAGVVNSAIIGGVGIIGSESDAVYMPRLRAGSQANGWDIRFDGDTTITGSTIIKEDLYIEGSSSISALHTTVFLEDFSLTPLTVYSFPTASYDGAWFEYTAYSASNARSGHFMVVHNGGNIEFSETSTPSIGDTSELTLSSSLSSGNFIITANLTAGLNWNLKGIIKGI